MSLKQYKLPPMSKQACGCGEDYEGTKEDFVSGRATHIPTKLLGAEEGAKEILTYLAGAKMKAANLQDKGARFEAGVSADPTKNMSPEDAQTWQEMNEKHRDNFKMAKNLPTDVERYVKEVKESNPDYDDAKTWATAWSIYCKNKNPDSPHCQKDSSEYFKKATQDLATKWAEGCPSNLDPSECKEWEDNTEKYKDVVKNQHHAALYPSSPRGTKPLSGSISQDVWDAGYEAASYASTNNQHQVDGTTLFLGARDKRIPRGINESHPQFWEYLGTFVDGAKAFAENDGRIHITGGHQATNVQSSSPRDEALKVMVSVFDDIEDKVGMQRMRVFLTPGTGQSNLKQIQNALVHRTMSAASETRMGVDRRREVPMDIGAANWYYDQTDNVHFTMARQVMAAKAKRMGVDFDPSMAIRGSVDVQADLAMSPADKKVVADFINRKSGESKKLTSNGNSLDGNWMGGTGIARWDGGQITMKDLGSRSAQTVQNLIKKLAPAKLLKEAGLVNDPVMAEPDNSMRKNPMDPLATWDEGEIDLKDDPRDHDSEGSMIPGLEDRLASTDDVIAELALMAEGCPDNLNESQCKEWEANTDKYQNVVKDQHTAHMDDGLPPPEFMEVQWRVQNMAGNAKWQRKVIRYNTSSYMKWMSALAEKGAEVYVRPAEQGERARVVVMADGGKDAGFDSNYRPSPLPPVGEKKSHRYYYTILGSGDETPWKMQGMVERTLKGNLRWDKVEIHDESDRYASTEKTAASAPTGLYGYTKAVQSSCEASIRKMAKTASQLAKSAYQKDENVAPFLAAHAKRGNSLSAKILVAAMKDIGPKIASVIADAEVRVASMPADKLTKEAARKYGLYGYATKTASLGLQACMSMRESAGLVASDLHGRRADMHGHITGFLTSHAKEAKCMHSKMLCASYPEPNQKTASAAPSTVSNWISWDE